MKTYPLALCDSTTIRTEDLVPKSRIEKDYTGESLLAKWNEGQKWVYLGGMESEEVVVMGIYYSGNDRKGCVHSSFLPEDGAWEGERESIEVRVMVFGGSA